MAVQDLWHLKDGTTRSARYGRGLRWRASWHGQSAAYRTKRAAEAAELRMRTEPEARPRDETTVGELVDLWVAGKKGLSPKGLEAVEGAAKHVRLRWGHEVAADLHTHEIQAWIAAHEAGPSLKHKMMLCLSGACRIGVRLKALDDNPCVGVKIGKEVAREGHFLTVEQVEKLAAAAGRGGPMVRFLAYTGVRIGECCALNVGDVTVTKTKRGKRVRVRVRKAKGDKARTVPVPAKLLAQIDLDRPAGAPLFPAPMGGRTTKDTWRSRVFVPAKEAVGMPALRPHDMRHTAASLMIQSGANVKTVQAALGHATAKMTLDLYGHLFDSSLDDVAARLDRLIS